FYLKINILLSALNDFISCENDNIIYRRYKLNNIEYGSGEVIFTKDYILIGDCSNFLKINRKEIELINIIRDVAEAFLNRIEAVIIAYDVNYLKLADKVFKQKKYIQKYER
ncbi:MAG: hypothetical protein L3J56_00945, partial [Bacteroidales bacterium]|nr:hypothetical protein [Bacteroidales bacterium]